MIASLRRLYNAVDRLFDRGAITQERRFTREDRGSRSPKTAREALEDVQKVMAGLSRQAQLKMIVSQNGIDSAGASPHWEFFFDLDRQRAQLNADWRLLWNEAQDDYGATIIEIVLKPYPSENSPVLQMVREGKLLHRQLSSLWEQESKRRPVLSTKFVDTDVVILELKSLGLDENLVEFSLTTGQSQNGRVCWIAQTRHKRYEAPFSEQA